MTNAQIAKRINARIKNPYNKTRVITVKNRSYHIQSTNPITPRTISKTRNHHGWLYQELGDEAIKLINLFSNL